MRDLPKFSTGVAQLSGGLVIGATGFWGLASLLLRLPLASVMVPWLVYSALGIVMAPFLYWSLKRQADGGDSRPFFVVLGAFSIAACPLLFFYASKFGLVPARSLPGLYLTAVISLPPILAATYYGMKRLGLLPSPRRGRGGPR